MIFRHSDTAANMHRLKEIWSALQNFKILQKVEKKISKRSWASSYIYVRMYAYNTHIYFCIYNKKRLQKS